METGDATQPWWKKWNNMKTHLYVAVGLRALLIAYGEYQVLFDCYVPCKI